MINLKHYIRSKKYLSKRLYLVAVALSVVAAFFLYFLPRTEYGVRRFYTKQLGKLGTSVESISKGIENSEDAKSSLAYYDKKLSEMQTICKKTQIRHSQTKNKNFKKQVRDVADGTKKLCDDLLPILAYSRELYVSLTPYILYDTSSWPPYDNEAFSAHMAKTQGMIRTTLPRLEKISYPLVDDPALVELIAQLKSADKLADDSYLALTKNDAAKSQELSEQLRKDMRQDKSDFMNARSYFWNNTVQIELLQQALDQLTEKIKS